MLERIYITGKAGAGKTTLGIDLEHILGRDVQSADSWIRHCDGADRSERVDNLVNRSNQVAQRPDWIVETGIHHLFNIFLNRATTVIFLDPSAATSIGNIAKRQAYRTHVERDGYGTITGELKNMVSASAIYPSLHKKRLLDILNEVEPKPVFISLKSKKEIEAFKTDLIEAGPENHERVFRQNSSPIPPRQSLGWSGRIVKEIMHAMGRDSHPGF